jgi:hypothetical protein
MITYTARGLGKTKFPCSGLLYENVKLELFPISDVNTLHNASPLPNETRFWEHLPQLLYWRLKWPLHWNRVQPPLELEAYGLKHTDMSKF